jgi:hypothetical protein
MHMQLRLRTKLTLVMTSLVLLVVAVFFSRSSLNAKSRKPTSTLTRSATSSSCRRKTR